MKKNNEVREVYELSGQWQLRVLTFLLYALGLIGLVYLLAVVSRLWLEQHLVNHHNWNRYLYPLSVLIFCSTLIAHLAWLYKVSQNLCLLGVHGVRHSSSRATLTYFIPILQLYRPLADLKEINHASDPHLTENATAWKESRSANDHRFELWWLCFVPIMPLQFFYIYDRLYTRRDLVQAQGGIGYLEVTDVDWHTSVTFQALFAVLYLCVAFLWINVARTITQRQRARFEALYGSDNQP